MPAMCRPYTKQPEMAGNGCFVRHLSSCALIDLYEALLSKRAIFPTPLCWSGWLDMSNISESRTTPAAVVARDDQVSSLPVRQSRPVQTIRRSALIQVFHLPELLELILLHLSQKDLLLSQRTSLSFRHTIRTSPRLQKALFFAPDWNLESRNLVSKSKSNRPRGKPENNRLLLRAFPGCYPTVTLVIVNDGDGVQDSDSGGAVAQGQEELAGRSDGRRVSEHWSWDVCISFPGRFYSTSGLIRSDTLVADRPPNTSPAVLYPEASWRKMFLSQPPCTSLHLVRRWQRSLNPAIVREEGIKMGEFVDEATKTSCEWHHSYISSDRDWHFEGNIKCSSLGEDGEDCEM